MQWYGVYFPGRKRTWRECVELHLHWLIFPHDVVLFKFTKKFTFSLPSCKYKHHFLHIRCNSFPIMALSTKCRHKWFQGQAGNQEGDFVASMNKKTNCVGNNLNHHHHHNLALQPFMSLGFLCYSPPQVYLGLSLSILQSPSLVDFLESHFAV